MECCSPPRWRRFPSSAPTRRRTVAFTASLSPSHHHHHHSSGYHKLPHRPPFDQSRYGAGDGIIDMAPSLRAPSIFSRARQETINDVNRDNNTIGVGDGGSRSAKAYQVAISCRGLRWEHLQVYFSLEFPETRVPLDQKTVLNENYIIILPRKLTSDELQDIDMLRGKFEDAEAFLKDFREEKAAGRYEAGNTMEALSPTGTSARRRSFFSR